MITDVSFLGLGNMGLPIALNLLRNGIKVYGYNRTPKNFEVFIEEGGTLFDNPQEAFEKAPVVFTMLSNDEALKSVSDEILKNGKEGCIFVSMSTVSPHLNEELAKRCAKKGIKFLSATVFGRPDIALAGKLWFCVSGDHEAKPPIETLLHYIGQKVDDFGDDPKTASIVKIIGNFMVFSTIELLAEGYTCAEKNGIDIHKINDFFSSSLFASPVFKIYGTLVANKEFKHTSFRLSLGQKDLNLFTELSMGLDLPLRDLLRKRIERAIEISGDHLDWSSISLPTIDQNTTN